MSASMQISPVVRDPDLIGAVLLMDIVAAISLIEATLLAAPPVLAAHVEGTAEGSLTLTVSQS